MAIRTREEIMETLKTRIGESTEDADISFLEDMTDTLNDYETRITDSGNWKEKYEENDREWRERYKERFFNDENSPEPDPKDPEPEEHKVPKTYEDLFSYE